METILFPLHRKSCVDLDINCLPVYSHNDEVEEEGATAELEGVDENDKKWDPLPCSKPNCQDDSECYCGNCKSKLCAKHKAVIILQCAIRVLSRHFSCLQDSECV